jgi:MFS family permease
MAAAVAVPAGRLCARLSQRAVAFAGAVSFALGAAWWFWRLGVEHHFFSALLPGAILVGLGVGLNMPALSSAAIAGLPPERLSTGSAVQNMSRQVGMALGVAIVVAIAGQAAGADSMVQFRYSFIAMGVAALGSGIASLALASGNLLANKGGNSDLSGKDRRRGPALQDDLGASPEDEAILVA